MNFNHGIGKVAPLIGSSTILLAARGSPTYSSSGMARTGGDDLGEDFATTPIDDESEEYNRKRRERTENPEDQISKEKKHKKRVQVAESENERSSDEAVASGLMKLFRK